MVPMSVHGQEIVRAETESVLTILGGSRQPDVVDVIVNDAHSHADWLTDGAKRVIPPGPIVCREGVRSAAICVSSRRSPRFSRSPRRFGQITTAMELKLSGSGSHSTAMRRPASTPQHADVSESLAPSWLMTCAQSTRFVRCRAGDGTPWMSVAARLVSSTRREAFAFPSMGHSTRSTRSFRTESPAALERLTAARPRGTGGGAWR